MIVLLRKFIHAKAIPAALFLFTALVCPLVRGAADDKEKKTEKEKKEKVEPWVEIRTAHFIVASDGGEKTARRIGGEFEELVRVFQVTMPNAHVTTGVPVRILAPRDGQSFARMAPEFPYDKRREQQPPGLIFFGSEKTYIGVRANAGGHFPYIDIFRNYARQILKLSYRNLPPWLEEGYSAVYGNLTFNDRGARLERPDPDDMSVLFESPLLPLDLVLHVDRTSPYYSPGNKGTVYFAESRVLLHYLITDPEFASTKSMERYITAVEGGADSLQAARDAFGDLNQLQAKLEAYIKNVSGPPAEIPIPAGADSGSAPRTLSIPEIEAREADFLALRGRSEDAQDNLEEALMNEPTLAEAEQSLGFLKLRKDDMDEAEKHFEHAAQLDPNDALNFYGQGLVAMAKAGNAAIPAGAATALEKSVALNPDFAPAWNNLATIYSQRNETLPKALTDAQRAASLAPGDSSYQLQVAELLNQMGHPEEARKTAEHVQETASDRTTADKAGHLIAQLSRPAPSAGTASGSAGSAKPAPASGASVSASATPVKPAMDSGPRIQRKTEAGAAPSLTPAAPATAGTPSKVETAPAPVPPLFADSFQVYSMIGTITEVNCASAPQIQITLKSQTITMKLHADDLQNVSIKSAGASTPAKSTACASLRGRAARISYHLVSEKPWDGEIQALEFRAQP